MATSQNPAVSSSRRLSYNPTLVNVCVPASGRQSATGTSLHDNSSFNSRWSANRQSTRGRALSGSSRHSVDHPLFTNHHYSPSPVTSDGSPFNTPRLPATVGTSGSVYQQQQNLHGPTNYLDYPPHHQSSTGNNIQQSCTTFLDSSLTSTDAHADVGASILSSSEGRRFSYDGNIPTNNNGDFGGSINSTFPPPGAFQLHEKGGRYCRRSRGDSVRSTNAWTTSGGTTPSVTAVNPYEDTTPSDGGLNQATTPVTVNLLHW